MKHHLLQASAIVAFLAASAPAAAADVSLAIPAGDLETALAAFSRATGMEVMSDPAQLRGQRTQGVRGLCPPTRDCDGCSPEPICASNFATARP
jgi:hypothetical protein